jgi:diguanylate cyclase (GGDEF)-like protein/PAS domain S-box-containing protein
LREALVIGAVAFSALAIGMLGLWHVGARDLSRQYSQHITYLARAAAVQVDPQLHQQLRDPSLHNGPEYTRAVEPLRRMLASLPDVESIYTMVMDGPQLRFVLDSAPPGDNDHDGVDDQAHLWEVYPEREPAMLKALGSHGMPGQPAATTEPYSDKWGTFMTGWAPLVDAGGRQYGILGLDEDYSQLLARRQRTALWALLALLPAALVIALLAAGYYRMRLRGLEAEGEARRAADALLAGQQRLKSVVDGTDVGTWESFFEPGAPDGGRIEVDARWAAMIGRSPGEMTDLTPIRFFTQFVHPDDVAIVKAGTAAAFESLDYLFSADVRMRHASGKWIWCEVRGKVIERDARGRPLRMVGTQMDVTARKQAEEAMLQSEASFRSLFELSPVGICQVEQASGRFLMVNDSLVASTGYSREELLRMTYWDITPPEWHEAERELVRQAVVNSYFGPYEKEYQRKDGSRYPVLVSGTHMVDPLGRTIGWAIVQDISERKAMELELADAARLDRLTGLANRTLFMERLQAAVERVRDGRQARFAVLFLDFDRFKLVNDALGHEAGDGLLREIAGRLRHMLAAEAGSLVARFGGDEFLVLLNDLPDAGAAEHTAERLLVSLAETYNVQGRDVYSSASIGIVTSEQCPENAEAVVRNADVAMYEAKRSGRACAVKFDDTMRARLMRHVAIDTSLRKAIGTPQFSLLYQPIIDLASNQMTSVEALARWHHPQLGQVSPAEFIPVAEDSGLIATLGQWVLQEACSALAGWRARDIAHAPGTISVNISRAELALGERLLAKVQQALRDSGLPAECLRLEVTERDVMRDPESTLKLMRALRDMGVHLAMDDFGTGTSSLGCLRDYPFDVIKIDQSFIGDVTGNTDVLAVLHAAITLVQNLGKTSVAEGVETAQQVAILQSLGCHHAQGYYFSRPLPSQQVLEFMTKQRSVARRA